MNIAAAARTLHLSLSAGRTVPNAAPHPRGLRARHRAVILYSEHIMLVTIAIILLVLWLLGVVVVPVGGSLIHGLLVVALVLFIWQFVGGRRGSV